MSVPATESVPEYSLLADAMARCGLHLGPSEAHGFGIGMLTAGVVDSIVAWEQELYSEFDSADALASECRNLLDRLFRALQPTGTQPLQLSLLLPEGIVADSARVAAVRDWCQGFLYGFGLGGEALQQRLSAEASDLLQDIGEFTRLDTEQVDDTEENRESLIEIEEYVREGVMLIHDELQKAKEV